MEARFTEAMVKFERDFMGRGPSEVKSYIIDDMVLVRFKGIITRAEHHLAAADASGRGRDLIKQSRMELMEKARPLLDEMVQKELGRRIVSLHTDISVKSGERIVVFVVDGRVLGCATPSTACTRWPTTCPARGRVVEARVCRVKNGIAANYVSNPTCAGAIRTAW
jgi:uncharacterized protein YbcI